MISWIIISSINFSSRSLCTFHVPIGGHYWKWADTLVPTFCKQSLLLENAFDLGCYTLPYTRFEPHPHKPWLNQQHLHWYNWWDMERVQWVGSDMNQGVYLKCGQILYTFRIFVSDPTTLVPSMSKSTGLHYNWPSRLLINQAWFISEIRPTLVPFHGLNEVSECSE